MHKRRDDWSRGGYLCMWFLQLISIGPFKLIQYWQPVMISFRMQIWIQEWRKIIFHKQIKIYSYLKKICKKLIAFFCDANCPSHFAHWNYQYEDCVFIAVINYKQVLSALENIWIYLRTNKFKFVPLKICAFTCRIQNVFDCKIYIRIIWSFGSCVPLRFIKFTRILLSEDRVSGTWPYYPLLNCCGRK